MTAAILRLTVMATACGLLLSAVYAFTRDDIRDSRAAFEKQRLLDVVGDESANLTPLGENLYAVEKDGSTHGFVFETQSDQGYNGTIELWVAIDTDLVIQGVRVKSHRETPGIGDKIELAVSDWIRSFEGKSLDNPPAGEWQVKKDGGRFDQFTGATITPRAAVNAVKAGLDRARAQKSRWLALGQEAP